MFPHREGNHKRIGKTILDDEARNSNMPDSFRTTSNDDFRVCQCHGIIVPCIECRIDAELPLPDDPTALTEKEAKERVFARGRKRAELMLGRERKAEKDLLVY
jgi:hypothetical protein